MTAKLKELGEDMYDTMYEAEGVGLAAPQVGMLKRIVVIDAIPLHFQNSLGNQLAESRCHNHVRLGITKPLHRILPADPCRLSPLSPRRPEEACLTS